MLYRLMKRHGLLRLALATAALAATWLVVLPWVGSLGPVREFVQGNEAAGINPSAVYYTEIDGIGVIRERMGTGDGSRSTEPGP